MTAQRVPSSDRHSTPSVVRVVWRECVIFLRPPLNPRGAGGADHRSNGQNMRFLGVDVKPQSVQFRIGLYSTDFGTSPPIYRQVCTTMPALRNKRHEAFCVALSGGMSGTQAYLAAGYACSEAAAAVAANRLLKKPVVAARVAELAPRVLEVIAQKTGITLAKVIDELAKIAFCNMLDYIRVGSDGDPYVDFTDLDRDKAAAVGEVVVEDFKDGRGEDARDVRRVRFKLLDKKGALVDIGKHLGGFIERKEVGQPGEFEGATEDELYREIDRAADLRTRRPRGNGTPKAGESERLH